jgi:replicative DNA helicase
MTADTIDSHYTRDDRAATELSVISAVLEAGLTTYEDVIAETHLRPSDFYEPRHEGIWAAIVTLAGRNIQPNAISVSDLLRADGTFERFGGFAYFSEVALSRGLPALAVTHAQLIVNRATVRKLTAAGQKIVSLAESAHDDMTAVIDAAQGEIAAVAERLHGPAPADDMDTLMDDVLESIESNAVPSTPTGLGPLDRGLAGGLVRESLTTIAARPGHGKTMLGLQIGLHVALSGGCVGYTSLEMGRIDLMRRAVSNLGQVDYGRIQRSPGQPLTGNEWARLRKAREALRDTGLVLSERSHATAEDIRSDIRAMIRRAGRCDLWVVDYLQLLSPSARFGNEVAEIGHMTRTLKNTARETGTPIVILAQLNREGSKDKREPIITDLRGSGSIEQDSDNVMLLHRYGADDELLKIKIAKNRRGPLGSVKDLQFEGRFQQIVSPYDTSANRDSQEALDL